MIRMNLFRPLAPVALFFSCLLGSPFEAGAQNAPVTIKSFSPVNVPKSGGSTAVSLNGHFGLANLNGMRAEAPGPIVRFDFSLGPYTGLMDLELFPEVAPATVANFRSYMTSGRYNDTLIHRSVPGFVIQGGGYPLSGLEAGHVFSHVATDSPIQNEFQRSNYQGTIAMAKIGGDLNSATSEWFINMVNNTYDGAPANLDAPTQKFTVFGNIIGPGFQTAFFINRNDNYDETHPDPDNPANDVKPWNLTEALVQVDGEGDPLNPEDPFLALDTIPLIGFDGTMSHLFLSSFLVAHTVREIPFIPTSSTSGGYLTVSATSSNTSLVKATISGTSLILKSVGSGTGSATITVKAIDAYNQQVQTSFNVQVVNPSLPTVSIALHDSSASEPGTAKGSFRVTRTGSTKQALTVRLSTSGSNAKNGTDFTTISSSLVIPVKATYKDIAITPKDDKSKEGPEKVKLSIISNSAYNISPAAPGATLTILDNEVPNITVSSPTPKANEPSTVDGTVGIIRFTRSGSVNSALTISFTVSGTATFGSGNDYLLSATGTIVIPATYSGADLGIYPQGDYYLEGLETVVVTASPSAAYNVVTPSATVSIFDAACPTVTVAANNATAYETGPKNGKFKFSRTGATTAPLTVFFTLKGTAKNGTDYTLSPSATVAVTIPAGSTYAYLTVKPKNDATKETDETVEVALKPTIYYNATPGTARVTINDND